MRLSGESGQWHENVDCTHLVLASGKLVIIFLMLLHEASVCVAVNVRSLVTALHFYSASSAFECNPGKSKDSLVGKFN